MKILIFISILLVSTFINAQNRSKDVSVSPEFKILVKELDDCTKSRDKDCIELANKIIEKGKRENVPYLDYLYFKKSYYFWIRNELDSAIVYSQLAIQNPHPIEKERVDLTAYNLLASTYHLKGDFDTSIDYFLKIAAILEDGGNPLHLGYLYSNIATVLGQTNNTNKQLEYLHRSFNLLDENQDTRFIATTASNLGLTYFHDKDTLNTIKWSNKALELSEFSNDLVAKTQSNLVFSFIEKDLDKSLQYAERSMKYADELKDKTQQVNAYYQYAAVLDKLGESERAIDYAEQAVSLAQEMGDILSLVKASKTAGTIFYKLAQKEKAADFYYIYAKLKDSISSAESVKEINEIHTKYETQKKEKQIAEQNLKIQKQESKLLFAILGGILLVSILVGVFVYSRKTQQLKLKQLQQEKENAILNSFILGEERERRRISHELHDGVAAMIGASKMSLESIPHLPQEKRMVQLSKVQGILEKTHAEIRHIAHNLLPTVLEQEGLIIATEQFVSDINETELVKISVTDNNSKAEKQPKQLQLMLFRVIQELVNNIIKHSQAEKAEIIFSQSSDGLQIEITDDGIGYEITNESGNHGLYSITQRLKSIGGNFKITKMKSGGTHAKVVLTV